MSVANFMFYKHVLFYYIQMTEIFKFVTNYPSGILTLFVYVYSLVIFIKPNILFRFRVYLTELVQTILICSLKYFVYR